MPQSGVVKTGHQEDTPTSVSCQKGLPWLVTVPKPEMLFLTVGLMADRPPPTPRSAPGLLP